MSGTIPKREQPLVERWRLEAEAWVEQDAAARLLEETKTATLSQMIGELGDMPFNRAEREVKASADWREYLERMVEARRVANLHKVRADYLKMRVREQDSRNYAARAEAILTR